MRRAIPILVFLTLVATCAAPASAAHPLAAPGVTSLTNPDLRYRVAERHYAVLERGGVRAIIADNAAIDVPELPGHRAGYSGIASLTHAKRKANLFVAPYAGLNFEHIHDGTTAGLIEKFEPRKFPMELRIIDEHTVELYQPPTGNWKLESCGRYHILEDGVIEYSFECIPRRGGYRNGYIGLFWASYIDRPEKKSIFFKGRARGEADGSRWIEGVTPKHGTHSGHAPAAFPELPPVDEDFPLTLVNHPSKYVYTEPWYIGVSHGIAFVQMFRQRDRIWMAQSPSGGGSTNPAWDFQWFIPDYKVGDAYGFVMRTAYLPFESRERVERQTREHRAALNRNTGNSTDISSRRELFVDTALIEKLTGSAKQKLHRPVAREVVLTTDAPWEGNTCAYYSVFRDGDLFRMYYRGSHWDTEAKRATHREVTCYAESKDGITWTKPELGLFEFDGSKANNIVLDGIGTHCFAAFKDGNPDCEPGARYKGIARGRPVGKKGLYVFQSPDGIRWSLIKAEPVITEGAFDSQNLAFWDAHLGRYREYHRTFVDGTRAIMTSTSKDFVVWSNPKLLTYQEGIPAQHLYTNAVQPYARAPHFLIGFPTRFLPNDGQRVEPTLMLSRDEGGRHFHRWLDPVIPESAPEDRGGNRSNYMAWGIVEIPGRPNHLSVYASEAYYTGPDSRLRRFEFRKDGFVSINADAKGGQLLTKPITFNGSRLELNAATSADGSVRVEIQSVDGKPLTGFALADCQPLSGDKIDATIAWKPGSKLHELAGKPVRLLFDLKDADLYSFRFAE